MTVGIRGAFVAALVALLPVAVHATLEVPVEFGEMVQGSQLVIHGRVIEVRDRLAMPGASARAADAVLGVARRTRAVAE